MASSGHLAGRLGRRRPSGEAPPPPPSSPPPPKAPVPQACSDWFTKVATEAKLLAHPPAPPDATYIGDPRYDAASAYLLTLRRAQGELQKSPLRAQCQEAPGYLNLYQQVSNNLDFYEKALDDHCGGWVRRTHGEHRDWLASRKAIIRKLESLDAGLQARDVTEAISSRGSPELGADCYIDGFGSHKVRKDARFKPLIETCVKELEQYRAKQQQCNAICERRDNAPSCPKF